MGVAVVGGQLPSFSWQATAWVLLIGVVAMTIALAAGVARGAPAVGVGAVWWAVPALIVVVVEVVGLALGSTCAHPTLSILLDPVLAGEAARTVAYLLWVAVLWALVRR